jgi:hypothetical protein
MSLMATRASRHLSPTKSEISGDLIAKIGGDALRCIKSIQMQKASVYRIKTEARDRPDISQNRLSTQRSLLMTTDWARAKAAIQHIVDHERLRT